MTRDELVTEVTGKLATKYGVATGAIRLVASTVDINEAVKTGVQNPAAGMITDECTAPQGKFTFEVTQGALLPYTVQVCFRRDRATNTYWPIRADEFTRLLYETDRTPLYDLVVAKAVSMSDSNYRYEPSIMSQYGGANKDDVAVVKLRKLKRGNSAEVPTIEYWVWFRNVSNQNIINTCGPLTEAQAQAAA